MTQGKIKKWFPDRAFGFIRADDSTSHDVFFHITQIANRFSQRKYLRATGSSLTLLRIAKAD